MSVLDRALLRYAPQIAERRELARVRTEQLQSVRPKANGQRSETRWRGASRILRSLAAWIPALGSGRTDLPERERHTLIARSQDAYRNHLIARAVVTRRRTNVVGTGLIAHPSVDAVALGISEDQAEKLNQVIGPHWRAWAENAVECDAEATLDFYGQTSLVELSSMLAGDVFALTPFEQRPSCTFGLKIQLVDGGRVSNRDSAPESRTLSEGVEMDGMGAPVAYHVRRRHPDDRYETLDGWDRVPVFGQNTGRRRALHVWNDKDRVGLTRGAPYLAPILEPLQTLEQYSRAELVAAVISAMFTVFLEKGSSPFDSQGDRTAAIDGETQKSADSTSSDLALGNGAIVDLAPGEKASFADPSRPNANYDPFFLSVVKQIGAALEIPLDELLLHYQSSYSAARAAMLQAWRYYTTRRWSLVQQFCAPIYGLWFDEAVARGLIPVTNYADPIRRAAYTRCLWVGPARGSMDEVKEATAAEKRIAIGVSNETIEAAAMMGEDWAAIYQQRLREINRRKADGTMPEPKGAAPPGKSPKEDDDNTQDPADGGVRRSGEEE